ncbi:MAG: 50S ribosomal protein L32 [bacterium]|nr:50S ribosomal protein L32 [bacterium]
MPEPRHHNTRGHRNRRRSHMALKKLALVSCEHCKKMKLPHLTCPNCGYYGQREVVNVLAKELKKKEKAKKKQ